ncbi:ABC transporter permease [Desulfovibrio litoralis]|uniref:Putative ABC transport system permease protein n=1 Tax=Desulfovibrio litoralis DSM 11393 TaxID=1121455 RepID=A0A1M7TMW2_9BACT|nr:iron export ABC transporter permease subunit FetB [Desulfovibrio litoralis]SHN71973.1 putative ABC transport system permease protein [Desulfovibrio litoralis DSM 11393]
MQEVVKLSILQFSLIYLLLIIVLIIMKKSKIDQTKLLFMASIRMTLQLILAGFVLSYIFANSLPIFTILYVLAMIIFSIWRVLSKAPTLNKQFKVAVSLSIAFSGLFVIVYFVGMVINVNLFNPQYIIPISGMIFGNAMTGVSLGLKTFSETLKSGRLKNETLLNFGVSPKDILKPYVNNALETALLPTMNSMLGMGIVSLPGMMTGQILAGTEPFTAIMYQIAIMIAICTTVCLAVFSSLHFGYKTLYNENDQVINY